MADVGADTRRTAIEALERIESDGAFANLVLSKLLDDAEFEPRDRGFVTELVYGTTRMQRAVDFLVDRFVSRDIEPRVRAALRVGAYQLAFLDTPPHAAVDATVAATPKRARGFVNAVLRKVAAADTAYPTEGIRLSYPDWIITRVQQDLGDRAIPILEAMNESAVVHTRSDGYRQDPASTAVADLVPANPGDRVADLCAAPGGKSTRIARDGAHVVGLDLHEHRAGLITQAAELTATPVAAVVADGTAAPLRPGHFDAVLIDAPCSGLGSLRRRADARWRIQPTDIGGLAELQFELVRNAIPLLRPGGTLVFSVCTLTDAESLDIDARIEAEIPELVPSQLPEPWELAGRGGRLLPDQFAGDGMSAFRYRLT